MKCEQVRHPVHHTWQMQTHNIREALGLPKRLDMEQKEPYELNLVEPNGRTTLIKILPPNHGSNGRSRFGHRIMARCWHCEQFVPAGRMSQHYRAHKDVA